jgi:hypothetical protein
MHRAIFWTGVTVFLRGIPTPLTSLLDSIAFGIEERLNRWHLDDYVAIVSPDLYVQAVKCTQNCCDALITCIRGMLGENGAFTYSCSLPSGTGVLFKPGGGRVSVAGGNRISPC